MTYPILYSLQHCPYAMRARMALLMAQEDVLLRAIVTSDKPKELLRVSAKGTVPVLVLDDGSFLEQSLDIMLWALKKNDPQDLLKVSDPSILTEILTLIDECDVGFRVKLKSSVTWWVIYFMILLSSIYAVWGCNSNKAYVKK